MRDKEKNKNPFKVPENYFDEVNRIILAKTAESHAARRISIFQGLRPVMAIAAAIAILLSVGYLAAKLTYKKTAIPEISELITSDPGFLIDEIDMMTLETDSDLPLNYEEGSGLSNDDIIDYLVSDDIDISVIYEKL